MGKMINKKKQEKRTSCQFKVHTVIMGNLIRLLRNYVYDLHILAKNIRNMLVACFYKTKIITNKINKVKMHKMVHCTTI